LRAVAFFPGRALATSNGDPRLPQEHLRSGSSHPRDYLAKSGNEGWQAVHQRVPGLSPYKISADLAERGVKLSHVTVRKIIAGRRIAT
jgi:hypothetical protein